MSRPTTRSKNKKHKQGNDIDITIEILRKINATGEVSEDDVEQLYMILKPVCHGCRVNTKDNPNCFCGFIPPPTGIRKTGLWQKTSEIIAALGPDPNADLRLAFDLPAGLTNLGATCYANSILQCLYMNTCFRNGIFSVERELLNKQPVLDQLTRLFTQLSCSKLAVIDSAPFIKSLELDNGVQQDSHEFLTLLLSLLECCLSHSTSSRARTIVQDLFCGSMSHVTTCTKCGKDSDASSKVEDFYELELNIQGLKDLSESLYDYLNAEELHGDNKYFCAPCNERVDALRRIKLLTLPPVLNLQLKRCVFHSKTASKKKITSEFSFPNTLDMQSYLCGPSQLDDVYELSSILIHRGNNVNSGHYIARIRDLRSGQWWEFDDEHVSKLDSCPSEDGSAFDPSGREFSSSDAYMLIYTQKKMRKDMETQRDAVHTNAIGLTGKFSHQSSLTHIFDEIETSNALYLAACQQYNSRKENEVAHIMERRQEVRSILALAPVVSPTDSFFWISADWLRHWADNLVSGSLDNSPIQCCHGGVSMGKIKCMKRLSAEAWTMLHSRYGGGPVLSKDDWCKKCIIDIAQSGTSAATYIDSMALMKDVAGKVLNGISLGGTYFVSRQWLQHWSRRKGTDTPCEADAGPTASICCPHGKLLPEHAPGARRVLIPENLWLFLYENASRAQSNNVPSCETFTSGSMECQQCNDELSEMSLLEDSLRVVKLQQRQNHEKLAVGKSIKLNLHHKYYLVPNAWIVKWRAFVNASGKNLTLSTEPELLDHAICSVLCTKHSQLIERPPQLICKGSMLFQKCAATGGLTFITESDWNGFCEEWGGSKEKGITAIVELNKSAEDCSAKTCHGMTPKQDLLDMKDDSIGRHGTSQLTIITYPEICEDCIHEKENNELMEKLNYFEEDIHVTLVHGKQAPRSILEASDRSSVPDRRVSKRSRKTHSGNSLTLKVSGSTSIYQLKMMIWESFGIVKENQMLHKGCKILDQDNATLASSNIFPGDKLWVQDSEIYEPRDIADELALQKSSPEHVEKGFSGTLLASNIS